MLEVGQTLDASALTPFTPGLEGTASAAPSAATPAPEISDSMSQSDAATFLSEFNKLEEAEQQDVVAFLDTYKESLDAGSDTSALIETIPRFLQRMIEANIGLDGGSSGYSPRLQARS